MSSENTIERGDTVKYQQEGVNIYPYVLYVKDGSAMLVITDNKGEETTELVLLSEIVKIGNKTKNL